MDAIRVQRHMRSQGASTKEIHRAALAHKFHRLLPGLGSAHSLNHNVGAAVLLSQSARLADRPADACSLHHVGSAQLPRCLHLAIVFDNADRFEAGQRSHMQNH